MENQDLVPHSKESQERCSNKNAKLVSDSIQAPSLRGQADEVRSTLKKSEDKCYKCKKYGHKSSDVIPTNEPRQRRSPDCQSFKKSYWTGGRTRRQYKIETKREATRSRTKVGCKVPRILRQVRSRSEELKKRHQTKKDSLKVPQEAPPKPRKPRKKVTSQKAPIGGERPNQGATPMGGVQPDRDAILRRSQQGSIPAKADEESMMTLSPSPCNTTRKLSEIMDDP